TRSTTSDPRRAASSSWRIARMRPGGSPRPRAQPLARGASAPSIHVRARSWSPRHFTSLTSIHSPICAGADGGRVRYGAAVLTIEQVETREQIAAVQELLHEYMAGSDTLATNNRQAPTFSGWDEEFASLPGVYAPPRGRLLLATHDGEPAGCVALKPHEGGV